ncbi:hypothetical protein [Endozoicomonas sp. ALD040]|uniref:hypothetical protein n=1 Tax=unclassified Endozoicomonas TaxID=2644528 RepID=UPI003BAF034D
MAALQHGSVEMILHLLQNGADPNVSAFCIRFIGYSSFHPAIFETESMQIIFLLLVYGADPNAGLGSSYHIDCNTIYTYARDSCLFNHYFIFFYWFLLPEDTRAELKRNITNIQELNKALFDLFPVLTITALITILSITPQLQLSRFPYAFRKVFEGVLRPFLYERNYMRYENSSINCTENWDE